MSDVLLGDINTKYFNMIANGKHRKKRIFFLDQDEGKIQGVHALKTYITNFYKKLFGPPEENSVSLDESITDDMAQVTQAENDFLTAPFSEEETKEAICPDGFPD